MGYMVEQANAELRKIVEGKLPATRAKTSKFGVGAIVLHFYLKAFHLLL